MIGCPAYKQAAARQLRRTLLCANPPRCRGLAVKARGRSAPVEWLVAETDVAQRLQATGNWRSTRARRGENSMIDTRRVNIVSEDLCCTYQLTPDL